jgi:alginate O-acetyltransferase complex protein AlgI
MLFNSIEFLLFFCVVTLLYFILPHRLRWILLLVSSCVFYMFFKAIYILILFFTIVIDYYAGIWIEEATNPKQRKRLLAISIIANVGVLAVFKYFNFLNSNISGLLSWTGHTNPIPYLSILLPIGLSFHTFQAMSYTIEVSRGNQRAERHFGIYALYVMFYPQLVAGPIERPQNIIHQFYEKHKFDFNNMMMGLRLMLWGLFKKVVIADRLAIYVNEVYKNHHDCATIQIVTATFFFTLQVYCDFSGYSDMAIGAAKTMGFDLMTNFNRPLFSTSVTELWRRWHISLSSWINDYLYTPLSISLRNLGIWGIVLALILSFSLTGLWHGASWNFVVYGFLNGLVLCYEMLNRKWRKRQSKALPPFLYKGLSIFFTLSFFSFSLIFFRSATFEMALNVSKRFLWLGNNSLPFMEFENFGILSFIIILLMSILMFIVEKIYTPKMNEIKNESLLNILFSIITATLIISLGEFNQQTFIYFQF